MESISTDVPGNIYKSTNCSFGFFSAPTSLCCPRFFIKREISSRLFHDVYSVSSTYDLLVSRFCNFSCPHTRIQEQFFLEILQNGAFSGRAATRLVVGESRSIVQD